MAREAKYAPYLSSPILPLPDRRDRKQKRVREDEDLIDYDYEVEGVTDPATLDE